MFLTIIVFNTCTEYQFCRALLCENWFVEDFCCFLEQYIIQKPFSVLFGPCVFVGTLYPVTSEESIDIRMEYGISGPEESRVSLCFYLTVKLTETIQVKGSFWNPKKIKEKEMKICLSVIMLGKLQYMLPKVSLGKLLTKMLLWLEARWISNKIVRDLCQ